MRCSICKKNEAIIRIHEYTNKGVNKINLCLECALEKGLNTPDSTIDNFIANMINNIFTLPRSGGKKKRRMKRRSMHVVCPECKTTINDFTDEMRAGCPTCYSVYDQVINLMIFKQNNSVMYLGKLPEELVRMKKNKAHLRKLKSELKRHVLHEDYASAAIVRDKIKEVKKTINTRIKNIANK